ncbi:hypothetical protein [Clostridium manihotivorum]|uniref:Uncharacterized protein n=1 Tax=Clostridium manihotivorum TaxID=2320868 RepID=A0A3R5QWA3_9CLOT|nr:hypothetical protein [Clostridium manihotivorum]QAA34121.1 hypothetical protein C1I91_22200 [Clostridium manihotivorum]
MIQIQKNSYLKDTPDYEDYSENVATLTEDEAKVLGISLGCCQSSGGCSGCSGCSSKGGCCNK